MMKSDQFAKFFFELRASRGPEFVKKKSQKELGDTPVIDQIFLCMVGRIEAGSQWHFSWADKIRPG
jgi:hypothetical protein